MISILAMLLQAAAPAPTAAPTPAPAPAPWTAIVRGDAAAGNLSTSTYVMAHDAGGRLAVRCDARADKVVSIQFRAPADLGVGPVRPVRLIIDGGTPLIANWEFISGVALEREDAAVTTITTAFAQAKQIKLHTSNLAGEPIDAVFDGPASAAGLTQVLAACGYTLGQIPARTPAPSPGQ
ncbi:hypothetical protein U1839_20525 [Sphingomonas sp. RT2P30]|uniref:hypothetical protein n=1 Tax=Parasphingomonas halimpatiens TaxID=3096162 RepID=UPI002FC70040